jgi:peptide/nickel transport system substrate-binding protein
LIRRPLLIALILTLLTISCAGPRTDSAPAPTSAPTALPHAPEIRFALVGDPADINVWALFDEEGAGYANYALRSDYWPRLYHLAPHDLAFEPSAAEGLPSQVIPDGDFYSATVTLRSDLKWTEGTPFTAEDVAFTVNTALAFELGFDWKNYYPNESLVRAEALDPGTVKFYFKQRPNLGLWQYGVLQGPVVQKAFWESRIAEALTLLPDGDLRDSITAAQARIAELQPLVDSMNAQLYDLQRSGKQNRDLEAALKRNQGDLDQANNNLAELLAAYTSRIESAHQALHALEYQNEPTLGAWMPAGKQNGAWVNTANPDFPFGRPNFDRALYFSFENEGAAVSALQSGAVDFILGPKGISQEAAAILAGDPAITVVHSPTSSGRFLVFNPARAGLIDSTLRAALSCMIDREALSGQVLQGRAVPFDSFVLPGVWRKSDPQDPCAGKDEGGRIQDAVEMLKAAGYAWEQEPALGQAGRGLILPDGSAFPPLTLLAPSMDEDALRASTAGYIEGRAQFLGIPLSKQLVSLDQVVYAVYSSKEYDLALLGWRLSAYPAYLCEWFGGTGPFSDGGDRLKPACEALAVDSDYDSARASIVRIQSELETDLPFIPLFSPVTTDAFRDLRFPYESVVNGWGGLYGAPAIALPSG